MTDGINLDGLVLIDGGHSNTLQDWIRKSTEVNLIDRIWARDHTIWKPEPAEISNRLGWLDVVTRVRADLPGLQTFAQEVSQAGIKKVLLLGMGGSSLAPELFARLFGGTTAALNLEVLDSTDPQAVLEKSKSHSPKESLYIVSSKSGGTVETFSLFKYFFNLAFEQLGAQKAGSHFIAITDPGSSLAKTAAQFGFRRTFMADPNIGGRYSALSHFGLVPAALIGVDLNAVLHSAEAMSLRCQNETVIENPGVMLGLTLGCLAAAGRDKVNFILPTGRASFGDWVEQLIAESTGKEGKGILPVVSEPALEAEFYGPDRVFVNAVNKKSRHDGHPTISMEWNSEEEIGGQFFLWEFATAVMGWVLGINPFDQPNVEAAKTSTRHFIDEYKKSGSLPAGQVEQLSAQTLARFLGQAGPGDYISLQVYAAPSDQLTATLQALRGRLAQKYGVATTLGYGPRFLHSTGQLHKGDRGNGLFVQLVASPPEQDLPIPNHAAQAGSDISFGVLKTAQALGDSEALRAAGRRVITFEVSGNVLSAVRSLEKN
ncbi:MAG: hypothetical protein WD740_08630 [Anaerolineales bacterium]